MGSVYVRSTAYNRIRAAVAIGRKLSELACMNFSRTTSVFQQKMRNKLSMLKQPYRVQ